MGTGSGTPKKPVAAPAKKAMPEPRKKSPTLNIFGMGGASGKKSTEGDSTKKQSSKIPNKAPQEPRKKSPTFSLFGSGRTPASKQSSVATDASSGSTKKKKPPTTAPKKQVAAPKGVPVLKQWKQVKGNAVEGRIFASKSFQDGTTVTTSTIAGKKGAKLSKGTVVQTQSGSKYFLE